MRFKKRLPVAGNEQDGTIEQGVEQALKNFRSSVHAWSEAEYSKPRTAKIVRLTSWRTVATWALGCVLAVGSVGGGVYELRHKQELARIAAAKAAEQQKLADMERVRKDDEDLLAKVDNDLSRHVPRAMEPLAQLMTVDEAQ